MWLDKVTSGSEVPDDINVIIEIPTQSDPVKYEVDKKTGTMFVDRFLNTSMHYPCNYGYIPQTLADDGDPADVLVLSPFPLLACSVIRCRPVGLLKMVDESGGDAKILAVPIDKLSTLYQHIHSADDVSKDTLAMIEHFFAHYKDLEPEKWVKVEGWAGPEEAKAEIMSSIERYRSRSNESE